MQDIVLYTYTQKADSDGSGNYNIPNTSYAQSFSDYMAVLRNLAQSNDYSLFDLNELLPDRTVAWSNGLYADSIHLSDVGGMFAGMFIVDALIPKAISSQFLKNSYEEIKWKSPYPYLVESIPTGVPAGDNRYATGILTNDNRVLLVPNTADVTHLLNVNDNTLYKNYRANFHGFSAGVAAPNGLVYFIPYTNNYIGVYDPKTDTLGKITLPSTMTMNYKFTGGVLAPNGKIYCIPYAADWIMTIDTLNNNALGTSIASAMSDFQWMGGVLAPNGKIYAGGVVDNKLLVLDTSNDTFIKVSYTNTNGSQFGTGCVAANGMVYFSSLNGKEIMKVNPVDNTITLLLNGSFGVCGAMVAAPDGYIYIMDNGNKAIKVLDPSTDTIIKTIDVSAYGTSWKGGVLAPNGKIYFIPQYSTNIVSVTIGLPKYPIGYFTSPYVNKY
jgi:hypothetical protein